MCCWIGHIHSLLPQPLSPKIKVYVRWETLREEEERRFNQNVPGDGRDCNEDWKEKGDSLVRRFVNSYTHPLEEQESSTLILS